MPVVLFLPHSIRRGYPVFASWPHFAACIRASCWFDCRSGASQYFLDLGSVVNSAASDHSFGGAVDTPNHLQRRGTDRSGGEDGFACLLDCVNSPKYSPLRSGSSLDVLYAVR